VKYDFALTCLICRHVLHKDGVSDVLLFQIDLHRVDVVNLLSLLSLFFYQSVAVSL